MFLGAPVRDFIAALPVCFCYYFIYVGNQVVVTEFVEAAKLREYTNNITDVFSEEYADAAEAASAQASTIMALYWVCLEIPSLISTLFLGPYSDSKGRKMAMIMPNVTIRTCSPYFEIRYRLLASTSPIIF